ncbi:KilA-N domain-containing protein [Pectobacterium punjabense]|uniref:KilA-N domain-containing protein n=1 Tax=Pectobacterium punjabense TaxID=2108399 RepID=UPI002044E512|nr:KilA-N domain-containing protein [Pectobacterium punjabense]
MTYPTVAVNGVSVRVDEAGRYSLNDLHAAAVVKGEATESQKPSKFLRSAQVKRFIKALQAKAQKCPLEQNQPLKVINGGNEPGVWGVEILAIRYAAWIKRLEADFPPEFNRLNFEEVDYIDKKGEMRLMYKITYIQAFPVLVSRFNNKHYRNHGMKRLPSCGRKSILWHRCIPC